jgi:FkbM family methyltransferase
MSFISYAQNLEDVMLYRALRHVERGFYIDVGAQHPVIESVTKAFYDRGWRGINIEPVAKYFRLLQRERPEDVNINVLVGRRECERVFHEFPKTGISTVSKEYADRNAADGYRVLTRTVACTTLDIICREHGVSTVHFLKVDVEGAEKEVLEGFAFQAVRPWVVVVEANEPRSTRDASEEWGPLLASKGYQDVYYDGLNRFFVSSEHADLVRHFRVPPNVFDEYITYPHHQAVLALTQLGPLIRAMIAALRLALIRLVKCSVRAILRVPMRSRRLRRLGNRLLVGHPAAAARLMGLLGIEPSYASLNPAVTPNMPITPERLSDGGRAIYDNLRDAYRDHGGE